MSVFVRLRICPGVPDPEWRIGDQAVEQRVRRWFTIAGGNPAGAAPTLPITGYRGFDVSLDERRTWQRVYRNTIVNPATFGTGSENIDNVLLRSNGVRLREEFGFTAETMASEATHRIEGLPATCDTDDGVLGSTQFRPSSWDDDPFCDNTCYGYAANVRTATEVFPDNSQRQMWSKSELRAALTEDGAGAAIMQVPSAPLAAPNRHYMVAVLQMFPGGRGGFHFLRLDRSGCWSHKVSTDPVTQVDDHRKKITNLCAARFRTPFVFVGFYVVGDALRETLRERGQP